MISYHGKKGVYTIKYEGWRLLSMITRVKNMPNATMTLMLILILNIYTNISFTPSYKR
jgi:hypothetical protein